MKRVEGSLRRALADVGRAESQPVSAEVIEVVYDELARLQKENEVLRARVAELEGLTK